MTETRKRMVDRMVRLYGFESGIVIDFCRYCEEWKNDAEHDRYLEAIVTSHEGNAVWDDED